MGDIADFYKLKSFWCCRIFMMVCCFHIFKVYSSFGYEFTGWLVVWSTEEEYRFCYFNTIMFFVPSIYLIHIFQFWHSFLEMMVSTVVTHYSDMLERSLSYFCISFENHTDLLTWSFINFPHILKKICIEFPSYSWYN